MCCIVVSRSIYKQHMALTLLLRHVEHVFIISPSCFSFVTEERGRHDDADSGSRTFPDSRRNEAENSRA